MIESMNPLTWGKQVYGAGSLPVLGVKEDSNATKMAFKDSHGASKHNLLAAIIITLLFITSPVKL